MHEQHLRIQINSYWHSGCGQSSGTYLDAVTEKNAQGLPFVGGRQLKGLLRHALRRASAWGWPVGQAPAGPAETLETLLFGTLTQSTSRDQTLTGMLQFSDGLLSVEERAWLSDKPQLVGHLYQPLYSTAINERGSAQQGSLRGIEVCVPLQLHANVRLLKTAVEDSHRTQQTRWLEQSGCWDWLSQCLPLVDAVGAHRSRGFGEAVLSLRASE